VKTFLLLGGGGYIGSVLADNLLRSDHAVRIYDRFFFGTEIFKDLLAKGRLELVKGDTRYAEPSIFAGIDAVIDLAGISNDPACDLDEKITCDINLGGAQRTAALAKAAGVPRYVYSSSCSIYGHGSDANLNEDSPKVPVSLYAKTKIQTEEELLKLHDDHFCVTFLRNATAYGLSRRMRFDLVINIMTLHAYKNRRIYVTGGGKQWRPLVHVQDIARACVAVLDAPPDKVGGEAFNVGSNDQTYQIFQIAQMVRDVVPHTEVIVVPDDPDKRTYHVDFSKIQSQLGFQVVKSPYEGIVEIKQALERGQIDDGIRTRTVEFYRYLLDAEKLLKQITLDGRIF